MASWTAHIEGGPKRVNHAAVCIDGYIYSFGGYCTGDDFGVRQDIDIHVYNTASYKWDKIEYAGNKDEIPYQRYGHTAVGFGQYCIIYGGRNDINGVSEHVYTLTWCPGVGTGPRSLAPCRWLETVTAVVLLATACIFEHKDRLYIFGGFNSNLGTHYNDIYMYNIKKKRWSPFKVGGRLPRIRRRSCCCKDGNSIYIFGGTSPDTSKSHLQSLTDLSDLHVLDMAPSLRTLCLMAVLEHKIRYEGVLPASLTCELHILSKAGASRLGLFLFTRILADGRDRRFNKIKEDPKRFFVAWFLQGVWVFTNILPTLIQNSKSVDVPIGKKEYLGWSSWFVGFLIQIVADHQKSVFRANPANADKFISTGLWRLSRHPNYFGEILMWFGLYLSAFDTLKGYDHLAVISPLFSTFILTKVFFIRIYSLYTHCSSTYAIL
ncbi:hypothetical protein EB796_012396 [Bugula neritina]|uniref:Attractin/MKLN-like beta-propeller domain-containing protein n=1 Tax=Bugula neritina TaxID=10212 RepID=A0A7J7JVC9_BUGNE|nr:hypothetical protein EB796_012396 [Bugula neritina]